MRTITVTDGKLPAGVCTEDTVIEGDLQLGSMGELHRFANGHQVTVRGKLRAPGVAIVTSEYVHGRRGVA
jgi:hypothetical protein